MPKNRNFMIIFTTKLGRLPKVFVLQKECYMYAKNYERAR